MRRFYLAYPGRNIQIAQTLSGRFAGLEKEPAPSIAQTASGQSASSGAELPFTLSWSHYVFLFFVEREAFLARLEEEMQMYVNLLRSLRQA
jgi:hypothetical protein